MTASASKTSSSLAGVWLGAVFGVVMLVAAWAVPVQLRSISPALLTEAGAGTPSLADLAEARLDSAQPGPAALLLAGGRAAARDVATVSSLSTAESGLRNFAQREPALMPWGGEDPFLAPLARQPAARAAVEKARACRCCVFS